MSFDGYDDPQLQALRVRSAQGISLQTGDDWYVLSMRWWDLWRDYTLYDSKTELPAQPAHLSRSCSGTTKGERPPNIDNSDLIIRPGCPQLQSGLVENRDFTLVNKEVWKLLAKWYPGGPALRRRVIGEGSNMRVELYPLCLTVYKVDEYGMPLLESKLTVPFSRSDTLLEVISQLRPNLGVERELRLWHRPSLDVDQTRIDSLEGWEALEPEESLEDQQVVDGASILVEVQSLRPSWPFFHRLRVEVKKKTYKDPSDPDVVLEVDDKIDCAATEERRQWDVSLAEYVTKPVHLWYVATVVAVEGARLLVQFHNRPKPKVVQLEPSSLVLDGEQVENLEVGQNYESLDSRGTWHQVRITKVNADTPPTYEAQLLDEATVWPVVQPENIRGLSVLKEGAKKALTKVFARYANGDLIESGGLRGLMSCATNEYIPEDSPKVSLLLREPFGSPAGVPLDGFLEYWRQHIVRSGAKQYWLQQELGRLFERAKVELGSEEEQLLAQGREWISRSSDRLAQYRSQTEPHFQDDRDFRDFRNWDKLDARFGREWKQAEVVEVDWKEMTVLVQSKQVNSVASPSAKAQKEWIAMESDRLAEYETKSLESPEHEGDPGPLLARSVSRGGVCPQPGACGLQNLGNTCFINSTLQCLSNSIELRTYFAGTSGLKPSFLEEISTSPLSTQGRIAREFSKLLRDMWGNEKKSVAPATLKKLIGQKRPEFAGYQQHDAQELLLYLLDALHEDVNRASYPYPNEEEDEKPKSDQVKAREMWDKHKRRSDSAIVDLFQFQIRSELTCPHCSQVSVVTFDPIMYLTLPVPKPPHSVSVTVLCADFPRSPPRCLELAVEKSASIEELETALWAQLQRSPSELPSCFSFADVYYGRIYKQFYPHQPVGEIRPNDNVVAFEVPLCRDLKLSDHIFIPLVCRKQQRPTTSSGQSWQYDKIEPPRIIAVSKDATNREVYDQMQEMAEDLLKACRVEEPWKFTLLTNLDNYASQAGDLLPRDDQLFEVPAQLSIDFDERAELVKDALPKAPRRLNGGPGTTLAACMAKSMEREVLSEIDSVYCRKCKEHRQQSKKLDLWSLPECLIVHLKRFGRERLDGPLVKIGCAVEFPMELDLEEYMVQKGTGTTKYQLYGVINHHGNVGGGHYTANAVVVPPSAKAMELGEWFNFNDSIVQKASQEELDSQAAYVLFYRRMR